jgi:outer membrane protein TolC
MTPETFTPQWAQLRQHLRAWWDQLTEHALEQMAGQHNQVVRVIQERYQYLRARRGRSRPALAGVSGHRGSNGPGPDHRGRRGGLTLASGTVSRGVTQKCLALHYKRRRR